MSAEKSRQSHRGNFNAAAISAVARADVRCARGHSLGVNLHVGAARGCPAMYPSGGGAEAHGVWSI
jgi:hypothetical protein